MLFIPNSTKSGFPNVVTLIKCTGAKKRTMIMSVCELVTKFFFQRVNEIKNIPII